MYTYTYVSHDKGTKMFVKKFKSLMCFVIKCYIYFWYEKHIYLPPSSQNRIVACTKYMEHRRLVFSEFIIEVNRVFKYAEPQSTLYIHISCIPIVIVKTFLPVITYTYAWSFNIKIQLFVSIYKKARIKCWTSWPQFLS